MTSRKRVQRALAHQQPDRVPIDFSSTGVTGIHVTNVAALRDHFGLEKIPVKVWEPYQMLGWLDEDLKQAMGIDVEGIAGRTTLFGFPNENWKEFRTPWGQDVLVPGNFNVTTEPNGDLLIYPEGDTSVPASGKMPVSGYYFDTIIRQEPLDESRLDVEDNLEEFKLISDVEIAHLRAELARVADSERGDCRQFRGHRTGRYRTGARALFEASKGHPRCDRVVHFHRDPAIVSARNFRPPNRCCARKSARYHPTRGQCHRCHFHLRNGFRNANLELLFARDIRFALRAVLSESE